MRQLRQPSRPRLPGRTAAHWPALLHERRFAHLPAQLTRSRLLPIEVKVGPVQLAIHQGFTVFVTEPDGSITAPSAKGLYFNDTRLISDYGIYANGIGWDLLNSGAAVYYGCRIFLMNRTFLTAAGAVPERSISLVVSRVIEGGLHEAHEITNHGRETVIFNHEVSIRSDFADVFEVKSDRVVRRGQITSDWAERAGVLTTCYRNGDFLRGLRLHAEGDAAPQFANGRLTFPVSLAPGQTWRGSLRFDLLDGKTIQPAPPACLPGADSPQARELHAWRAGLLTISSSVPGFVRLFDQAVEDMAALRVPMQTQANTLVFVPAAGLPWFVALFGRDTLITSMQSMILGTGFARGTLEVLGAWQATTRDDFRDAEPGKILHELRQGELAHLKLIPHTPYYGTADATPLYLMLLHQTWKATADDSLLRQHLPTALACLDWIDQYGDRDGDGFQEYGTRSGQGYENVGWKDSGEAVVDPAGALVKGPKALCELQGYVYAAWRGMAEAFAALDDPARAAALTTKADALYARFNQVFWNEAEGFYAYCLDGAKNPVWTVASNPGHLLWCGIVPPGRAARVIARLMQPDMWTGWGIRTLTDANPTFNPYSYQNGSVWPHDNSLIALGFARYGHGIEAAQVASDIQQAGSFFTQRQLPELYAGVHRDETSFPVQYLGANVPQAWAAASVFALLQAMIGLEHHPAGRIVLNPNLPEWLPDLTLHNLQIGSETLDIAFTRHPQGTSFQVLKGNPARITRERGERASGGRSGRSPEWPLSDDGAHPIGDAVQ